MPHVEWLDEYKVYGRIIIEPATEEQTLDEYARFRERGGSPISTLERRLLGRAAMESAAEVQLPAEDA